MKKDYDSTRIYRNTQKKRVRHRLMTHPHQWQQCVWPRILVSPGHLSRTSGKKTKRKIKNITEYLAILAICRIFAANI